MPYEFGETYLGVSPSDESIKSTVKDLADRHKILSILMNEERNIIRYEYYEEAKKKEG